MEHESRRLFRLLIQLPELVIERDRRERSERVGTGTLIPTLTVGPALGGSDLRSSARRAMGC